jgi:hypothetical protein
MLWPPQKGSEEINTYKNGSMELHLHWGACISSLFVRPVPEFQLISTAPVFFFVGFFY